MEMQTDKTKIKWFHKPIAVIAAVLILGVFALPIVWTAPLIPRRYKIIITALVIILTLWLFKVSYALYSLLAKEINDLAAVLR